MPYTIKSDCVYKKNADGSLKKVKCYPGNHAKALKLQRALTLNVDKERTMSRKSRLKEKARRQRRMLKDLEEQARLDEIEAAEDDEDEEELLEQIIAEVEGDDEPESTEKSYHEAMSEPVFSRVGARSWEEMDAVKEAMEKKEKIDEATYAVQDMVRNILYDYSMSPEQKVNAIKAVGDGFGMRVQEIADKPMMDKEFEGDEIEVIEAEMLIAKDSRNASVLEKIEAKTVDLIEKAKLSYASEKKLSDSDFALVYTDPSGKKVRKYPIHDKAHVRNALARAAQQIKGGGEGAADARKALPKIKAAAKKMGIGMMKERHESLIVEKDASGQWRAVLWPTNRWMDYDGEILTDIAHKEYVEWVNENMDQAPVFITKHIPGTRREDQVDFVGYENGFVIMSLPLTEKEASGLMRAQTLTDVGLSHGSFAIERDKTNRKLITKYRMYEVSDLPISAAANPFTNLEIISKEVGMNTKDTKEYLAAILGSEEEAEQRLKSFGVLEKTLDEAGVKTAEKQEETQNENNAQGPAVDAPNFDMEALVKAVGDQFDIEGLNQTIKQLKEEAEKVPVLEALIKDLRRDNDEQLAEKIAPPITKSFAWSQQRPSQSDKTVLKEGEKEDDELLKSSPEAGWLSQWTGTEPLSPSN